MSRLLVLAMLLLLATGCSGPGDRFGPPEWLFTREVSSVTSQGVTLRILYVHSQQSPLFRDMKLRRQSNLALNYALYTNKQFGELALLPGSVILTDDTGTVNRKGEVTHLASMNGVSIGFIRFDGGPVETSNTLSLAMENVLSVAEDLDMKTAVDGQWTLPGFLGLRFNPPTKLRDPGFMVREFGTTSEKEIDGITLEVVDAFYADLKNARIVDTTPVFYQSWLLRNGSGESQNLLWAELRDGTPRLVTLTEYMNARERKGS